jgi:hypothetical protein
MFKVIFTNGVDDVELTFKVHNTVIAKKWFSQLSKNYNIFENDRFTNWSNTSSIDQLNQLIDIINSYQFIIDKKLTDNFNQADLNYLHTFFENLRGEVDQKTEWFVQSPANIQIALEQFNILIHQLESNLRTTNHPTCVVTFRERPKLELDTQDNNHFTFRWVTGTVYINYCHVGKTILDVYKDKDHLVKAVRPQTHYSADFMIKFGPTTPFLLYLVRKILITVWLKFQPFKFKNPNIGMIPVATLVGDFDFKKMKNYKQVKQVICLK